MFLLPIQYANDYVGSVGFILPNLEIRLVREENEDVRFSTLWYLFDPTETNTGPH